MDELLLGSGTVTTAKQAEATIEAGAEFVVSPSLHPEVIAATRAAGKLSIPGALTPTEVITAERAGADYVKIFPCSAMGGASYLEGAARAVSASQADPHRRRNAENRGRALSKRAPARSASASDLVNLTAIDEGKPEIITEAAKAYLQVLAKMRANLNARQATIRYSRYAFLTSPTVNSSRQFHCLILINAMFGHQLRQESRIDAPGHIVPRRNRQKRPRVVIESHRVVEARRLRRLLAESAHPFRAVVEPPWRAQFQARIMPGQRRQFPAVGRLVQREQNDRQPRLVAEAVQQGPQRVDITRRLGNVGSHVAPVLRDGSVSCDCAPSRDGSASPARLSTLMRAISVNIWPRKISRSAA